MLSAHEFGLLATGGWASHHAPRTAFSRELAQRMALAEQLGIRPAALALRNCDPPAHLDLLVKRQIPVLRLRTDRVGGAAQSLQPRLARYGIWQLKPTIVVPVASRWSLGWTARNLLQRAEERGQTVHLAVDGAQLARSPASGLSSLRSVLHLANARAQRGYLQVVTPSDLLAVYSPRRGSSRSVLHAA
jgi:hypothetical protein